MIRASVLLLTAVAALAQQPQPAQPKETPKLARIEGTVVSSAGAPVPRAQVRLQGGITIVNGQASQSANYSATTDDTGAFVIDNIEAAPGLQLSAQKAGFLQARYGQRTPNGPVTPLSLSAGQTLKGAVLTMTPQGVVSGRVTDANGDPIQSVQVALQRRAYQRGVRQLLTASSGSTNDQGEFRIANVAPGRYYIQATSRTDAILSNANGSQASTAAIPTFYPNATDPRGAAALDVAAGQELRGLEIQMRTGSVYSVSGKIVSGTGEALQNPRVMVLPRSGTNTIDTLILSQTLSLQQMRPDGSFQVRNLTPGPYTAQVVMPVNNQTRSMATFDFDITDKNVTDLVIATTAAAPITGSVRLEGGELKDLLGPAPAAGQSTTQTSAIELAIALDPAAAAAAGITLPAGAATRMSVGLQPMVSTPLGGNTSSQVYADGNIKLEGALPGRYYLGSAAPQGTYIKSVRFNGTDVTRTPIEVPRGGGGTLEILLAKNPAGISGTVQTEKGDPMPAVVVSLWPQDPDQASAAGGVRTFTTAQNGTFQAQGLRPGTYYVAAFEVIDSGLVQARDFLTQLTGDATKVELKEGSTPSVQLKVIPEAKIKAAEEKLP